MTLELRSLLHNRYRVEQIIAQGGMGAIYRATDESLGVEVAIKENLFTTEELTRQFRREATILAGLRHPNLPRVTDHFVIPGQGQYLVMDYIAGEDLRQIITRDGKIPESEVVFIGSVICDALSYLHSRPSPIIHRDIKPGNIKVTPTRQIYLVDFGLAKEFAGGAGYHHWRPGAYTRVCATGTVRAGNQPNFRPVFVSSYPVCQFDRANSRRRPGAGDGQRNPDPDPETQSVRIGTCDCGD